MIQFNFTVEFTRRKILTMEPKKKVDINVMTNLVRLK